MFDVRFFRDPKGKCPVLISLNEMQEQAEAKAYVRIEQLAQLGNNLQRPLSDYLRDGIYELRWRFVKVQYRLLYFFSGKQIIVLSHIITKKSEVPDKEIDRCIFNKNLFEKNPEQHTYVLDEMEA